MLYPYFAKRTSTQNDPALKLPTYTKTGWTFNGWNTKKDGTGTNYAGGANYTPTANVTLYARWTRIQYDIKYTYGTTTITDKKNHGETYVLRGDKNTFTRAGYELIG